MKNFFISYNQRDKRYAEWIGWQLEEAGYTIVIQAWHFMPGSNFVTAMHNAIRDTERALILLSPNSLNSKFVTLEWAAIIAKDPDGSSGRLCPVRVAECSPDGLLAAIAYIDLVGARDADEACARLLDGLRPGKPRVEPATPGFGERILVGPARTFPVAEAVGSMYAFLKRLPRFLALTVFAALLILAFLSSVAGSTPPGYAPVMIGALIAMLVEGGLSIAKRRRRHANGKPLAAIDNGELA